MGLINDTRGPFLTGCLRLLCTLCLAGGASLFAQNAQPGIPAGAEIQNLERAAARPGISGAERHDALVRLARLRQLSGDLESAAKNWLDAAEQDKSDDNALTAGAFCLAAMGEWERAAAALRPLLQAGRPGPALLRARYLDACLKAWGSGTPGSGTPNFGTPGSGTPNFGDAAYLSALADNTEYTELKSEIFYTLWKTAAANPGLSGTASAETWKQRLLAEFPHSPEGRIAAPETAPAISASPALSGSSCRAAAVFRLPRRLRQLPQSPQLPPMRQARQVQVPSAEEVPAAAQVPSAAQTQARQFLAIQGPLPQPQGPPRPVLSPGLQVPAARCCKPVCSAEKPMPGHRWIA
ncbi:hypothetical protein AGMMS50293_30820 [Spirochaetia bacterium]|nr:hypothetical protein AGMMS50293_30820 [Spirochaetia bacterium]